MSRAVDAVEPSPPRVEQSREAPLREYLRDRFPLPLYGALIAGFTLVNHSLAQALERPDRAITLDLRVAAAWLTMLCLFFQLRVFDDDKDYADDCRLFPERALQRGAVTRRHLLSLAGLALAVELSLAAISGPPALSAAAIASSFSLLMWRGFFARDRLRRHFLPSALLHLMVMPLLALVIHGFATGNHPWQASPGFLAFALLGYLIAFTAEISRKVRAPEDERTGVDTYSSVLGTDRAAGLLAGLVVAEVVLAGAIGMALGLPRLFVVVLCLVAAAFLAAVIAFARSPTPATARGVRSRSALYLLGFDVAWIVFLALQHGIRWQ